MATTTSPAETQIILVSDGEPNGYGSDDMIKVERIEHLGGEVDFFLDCRDWEGQGPELKLSLESAERFHAWLGRQLGK